MNELFAQIESLQEGLSKLEKLAGEVAKDHDKDIALQESDHLSTAGELKEKIKDLEKDLDYERSEYSDKVLTGQVVILDISHGVDRMLLAEKLVEKWEYLTNDQIARMEAVLDE